MVLSLSSKKASGESGSNPLIHISDPPELKRQRDRARLAECRATRLNIRILAVPAAEKDVNKGKGNGKEKGKGKGKKKATNDIFTKNIVYKEVLTP